MLKEEGIKFELVADREPDHGTDSPLRLVHRVLRGRYRYVAILSTLLALAGGLVGYRLVEPVYQSTGLVRVEGAMPVILYPTQESAIPPMFEAYMATQVVQLQSWKVLERAVVSQEMRDAGWPSGSYGVSRLQEAITVTLGRGGHIIRVAVSLPDPGPAQIAVNAVLAAYDRDHTYPGGLSPSNKEQILVAREEQLVRQIAQAHEQILDSSGQFGVGALDRIHARKLDELLAVEQQLADIRLTRLRIGAGETLQGDSLNVGLSPDDEQELALRAEIASLEQRFRPGHPALVELNRRIDVLRTHREMRDQAIQDGDGQHTAFARLDALADYHLRIRDRLQAEAAELGRKQVTLATLQGRVAALRGRLDQTRQRIDELRFTSTQHDDRVTIIKADRPMYPVSDRRQGLAAAAAIFGMFAGAGIVFLIGRLDTRVRSIEELEALQLSAPIIGVLGTLHANDLMSERRAAWTIHQLRNLLEIKGDGLTGNVFGISSCDHDEGRTSIVLGLGSCFAGAGRRTLVIDADFARSRLSTELGLGGVAGMCEALGPCNETGRIHPTSRENLWCMPFGSSERLAPQDLSPRKLEGLLRVLRRRFDAIIVDTGPILADVEAGLVAASMNTLVMVVGRHQRSDLIRSSFSRLEQLEANCVGVLFNKATPHDVRRREAAAIDAPPSVMTPDVDEHSKPVVGIIGPKLGTPGAERKRAA